MQFHIELLIDLFANLTQVGAALATQALGRFTAVLDALQLRWQRLASRVLAWQLGQCLVAQLFIGAGEVHVNRLVKQQAQFAKQGFAWPC